MKRFLAILLSVTFSLCALAQAQVTILSKKDKLGDIPTKTMKVVLLGEDYVSLSLRDAVKNSWSLSPYEFCTVGDFNELMNDDSYYFMIIIQHQDKKDEGIWYLSIVKGGSEELNDMREVITLPLCPSDGTTGREAAYMPAIVDIMQAYIEKALTDGFKGIGSVLKSLSEASRLNLVIDETDLSEQIDGKLRTTRLPGLVRSEEEAANMMLYGADNTAVGYTIAPFEPKEGALCYKLLFDARTHDLYYYQKHKLSPKNGRGFLKKDIMKLTAGRQK